MKLRQRTASFLDQVTDVLGNLSDRIGNVGLISLGPARDPIEDQERLPKPCHHHRYHSTNPLFSHITIPPVVNRDDLEIPTFPNYLPPHLEGSAHYRQQLTSQQFTDHRAVTFSPQFPVPTLASEMQGVPTDLETENAWRNDLHYSKIPWEIHQRELQPTDLHLPCVDGGLLQQMPVSNGAARIHWRDCDVEGPFTDNVGRSMRPKLKAGTPSSPPDITDGSTTAASINTIGAVAGGEGGFRIGGFLQPKAQRIDCAGMDRTRWAAFTSGSSQRWGGSRPKEVKTRKRPPLPLDDVVLHSEREAALKREIYLGGVVPRYRLGDDGEPALEYILVGCCRGGVDPRRLEAGRTVSYMKQWEEY